MSDLSNYSKDKILNALFRATNLTAPATVYLALFTSATGDDGTGTEVSGGSYARQEAAFDAPETNGGYRQIDNTSQISFPVATANWGTITHAAVFDASSGGNMLIHGALSTSRTINTSDQLKFDAGEIKFQMS